MESVHVFQERDSQIALWYKILNNQEQPQLQLGFCDKGYFDAEAISWPQKCENNKSIAQHQDSCANDELWAND